MPARVLVTHAVLHCNTTTSTSGRSDKIWAGVVVATPGQPAQTYTLYGRRGATLTQSTKNFATTPEALRYFDAKMTEKLERHDYFRCNWRDNHYGVRYDLPNFFPELLAVRAFDAPRPTTPPLRFAALPRPATPVAYPAGIYEVDQESAWWYVVPDDVGYGYATSPNALLIERGYAGYPPKDARLLPTWVWRASKKSAALLAPKALPWHHADEAKLLQTAGLELIAAVLGGGA